MILTWEEARPNNGSPLLRGAAGVLAVAFLAAAGMWAAEGQWPLGATAAVFGGLFGVFAVRGLSGLQREAPVRELGDEQARDAGDDAPGI